MNDLLGRSMNRGSSRVGEDDLERGGETHSKQAKFPRSLQLTNMPNAKADSDFFREIEVVQGEVQKVRRLLGSLQSASEEIRGAHRADAVKALRTQMDADIASVTKSARLIKAKLVELDRSNLAHREEQGCGAGTVTDRQRMTVTELQRKKLKELIDEFQALRARMVDEYRQTIERRYFAVTGKPADEAVIEDMIRTGESETFLQQVIREQGRGHVVEAMREIQERHDGVREIEKHLLELHSIFMDISVLVDAQGHLINDIEANVTRAKSFTEHGVRHLDAARRHQLSKRKWTCVCVLLLIVLIAVLIIALKIANII